MTVYALAYAEKGTSFVCTLDENNLPKIFRLTGNIAAPTKSRAGASAKTSFLAKLQPGDIFITELGGHTDRICLAAMSCGAEIWRYPDFLLGTYEERMESVSDSDVEHEYGREYVPIALKIVHDAGWEVAQEHASKKRSFGKNETNWQCTARKTRAMALQALWRSGSDNFLKADEDARAFMRLRLTYRSFNSLQRSVLRSYQALIASYKDEVFLDFGYYRQQSEGVSESPIHEVVLQKLLTNMLGEMSEAERQSYFVTVRDVFEGGTLPWEITESDVRKIIDVILESDVVHETMLKRLSEQKKRLEKLVMGASGKRTVGKANQSASFVNYIFKKVFRPIPGCGPLIAARIMAAIGDIRRFESPRTLKAYAGYHHFSDGSRFRRIRGKNSNVDKDIREGVYLFCDQTLRQKSSPWRARLDVRRAYELYKMLREGQVTIGRESSGLEILPSAYSARVIEGVQDMDLTDLVALSTHVDNLRRHLGVISTPVEEDEDSDGEEEIERPGLTQLLRGIKGKALRKGMRWLGQMFLKHVFKEWRKAIDLSEISPRMKRFKRSY